MKMISNYKNQPFLVESFNELAQEVFGLDFSSWYDNGYWGDSYIPFSFVVNNKIVANVSVSMMTLKKGENVYSAVQIGTVMTHPDYRNQGLAKKLIEHILEKYENKVDVIYLFANESVLDFYPKFGFKRVQELSITIDTLNFKNEKNKGNLSHITITEKRDLVESFVKESVPQSDDIAVVGNTDLLYFYLSIVFKDMLYYSASLDALLILEKDGNTLHLYDVLARAHIPIDKVLNTIVSEDIKQIKLYFNPKESPFGVERVKSFDEDDVLFVKTSKGLFEEVSLLPITSHS